MILRARFLLLWLLALAIPVQGIAAVLQSGCAPGMLTSAPMQQPQQPQHRQHQMQPMSMDMHEHGQPAQQVAADDMAHMAHMAHITHMAHMDHTSPHQQHKSSASCSSCATCSVGAMLPLALAQLPTPDLPGREYLALPASGFVGYTPENPDRPPALS